MADNRLMFALALAWKVGLTVLIGLAGVVVIVFTGLFGPGSDPETGEGSSSWITVAVLTAIIICSIWILGGCTQLSSNPQEREINHEFMEHHMDAIVGGQH